VTRIEDLVLPVPMPVEALRALLRYDPATGSLWWLQSTHGRRMHQPAGVSPDGGYASLMLDGRRYQVHVLIWCIVTGEWRPGGVDHEDLDKGNNRWSNLRPATQSQNSRNVKCRAMSGFKGVYPTPNGKWTARIKVEGKIINYPSRITPEEAWQDYCAAARKHFGEFARLD
jgi:HNH endonuclease